MVKIPVDGMEGRASRDMKSGAIIMHDSSAYNQRVIQKAKHKSMHEEMKKLKNVGVSLNKRIGELEQILHVVLGRFDEGHYGKN